MDIAKSSLKVFIARVCNSLASFAAVVIFSRELGASPLGTYYPFIAFLSIMAIPANFGISYAAEKRISEGEDASQYLATAIIMKIPPLIFIAAAILLFGGYVNQFLGADLAVPLVLTLFISQAGKFSIKILRGELRVGETAFVEALRPLGWLSMGYLLYLQGMGVYALVYGYLFGSLLMVIVGWWRVSTTIGRPTMKHARSLLDYGQFNMISSVGGSFYSWMDVLILTAYVTIGIASSRVEIGAYENAWRLSLVVMMLTQSISVSIFPQMSQWDADGEVDRIESLIPKALLPGLLVVIPAFAGISVLSRDLLGVLFGAEFTVAWIALIILAGEKILQSMHSIFGRVLWAIDRPAIAAYAMVITMAINLVGNIILIWQFGIVGAALATTMASAVLLILQVAYLRRFVAISFPVQEVGWAAAASGFMAFCIYAVRSAIEVNSIVDLLSIVLFGGLIYSVVLFSYTPVRESAQKVLPHTLSQYVP